MLLYCAKNTGFNLCFKGFLEEKRLFNNWNRALLVSLQLPKKSRSEAQNSLKELSSLAFSLGGDVAEKIIQVSSQIHPANFFWKGEAGRYTIGNGKR